jgi:hypothetical protein
LLAATCKRRDAAFRPETAIVLTILIAACHRPGSGTLSSAIL